MTIAFDFTLLHILNAKISLFKVLLVGFNFETILKSFLEKLVQAGVSVVVQPSGSKNDKKIIKFANQTNTILVFSKTRHFNH